MQRFTFCLIVFGIFFASLLFIWFFSVYAKRKFFLFSPFLEKEKKAFGFPSTSAQKIWNFVNKSINQSIRKSARLVYKLVLQCEKIYAKKVCLKMLQTLKSLFENSFEVEKFIIWKKYLTLKNLLFTSKAICCNLPKNIQFSLLKWFFYVEFFLFQNSSEKKFEFSKLLKNQNF